MDNKVQDKRQDILPCGNFSPKQITGTAFFSIGTVKETTQLCHIPIFQSHKLVFIFDNKTCKQRL